MAVSAKRQDIETRYSGELPRSVSRKSERKWELRLGVFQLVAVWCVVGCTLVGVFLFGLVVGQEQGLKAALDEQAEQLVRLPLQGEPIVTPAKDASSLSEPKKDTGVPLSVASVADTSEKAKAAEIGAVKVELASSPVVKGRELSVGLEKQPVVAQDAKLKQESLKPVVAGFQAKPAGGEVIIRDLGSTRKESEHTVPLQQVRIETKKVAEPIKTPVTEPVRIAEREVPQQIVPASTASTQPSRAPSLKAQAESDKLTIKKPLIAGWYVQIAALQSGSEANRYQARLREAGYSSEVRQADINQNQYFRVLAGPYSTKQTADVALGKIKRSGVTKGEPFLKYIQ